MRLRAAPHFKSTGSIHGGQETPILTSLVPLLHLGMVFVGLRYSKNPQLMTTEGIGGTPYGPSTMPRDEEPDRPVEEELETARSLGRRVSEVAARLKRPEIEEHEEAAVHAA